MLELNKDNFETEVLQVPGKILVDFFGDGCAPCEAIMPFIVSCAEKYGEQLKFAKLNTTKARRLAISQKVLGLPAIVIYESGQKVEELVKDEVTEANIEALIQRHI